MFENKDADNVNTFGYHSENHPRMHIRVQIFEKFAAILLLYHALTLTRNEQSQLGMPTIWPICPGIFNQLSHQVVCQDLERSASLRTHNVIKRMRRQHYFDMLHKHACEKLRSVWRAVYSITYTLC